MAAWPGGLPQNYEYIGYQETLPISTVRTAMEVGPDKVRKRTDANPRNVIGVMKMTAAQLVTLETFYNTTTNGGADQFTFPFRTGTENARFLSPPAYTVVASDLFNVSLALEVFA